MIALAMLIVGTLFVHAQTQPQTPPQTTPPVVQAWKVGDSIGTITTTDGTTYTGAKLTAVDPDGISILYADGGAKIAFTRLSPELQKKFGYDPQQAAFYVREQQYLARIDQLEQENAQLRKRLNLAAEDAQASSTPQHGVASEKAGYIYYFNYYANQSRWSSTNHAIAKAKGGSFDGLSWGQAQDQAQQWWAQLSDQDKLAYEQKAELYGSGRDPSLPSPEDKSETSQTFVAPAPQTQGSTSTEIDMQTGDVKVINQ